MLSRIYTVDLFSFHQCPAELEINHSGGEAWTENEVQDVHYIVIDWHT